MALTDLSGRLRRRWDYEADPAAALSFDEMADQLNIRRTELAVLASIANATVQIYLGVTGAVTIDTWMAVGSIPVCLMFLAGASVLQTRTHHRATRALPILFCVFSLILAQAAISIIASDGRLTAGSALVVLAVALVFVFPPRTLVFILGAALASYALVVLQMPVSDWEKAVAFLTAAMCTGVAIAGGALIYMGRQRDHEQKAVIYAQNVRLTARERELKEFMAITAHDLRSPLLGLRNLLRLASRRAQTSPDLPLQVLGAADHSLAAMLGLIDTMLEAHKAEHAPGSPMVIEDLRQPVQAAIERFRPLAESKAVTLAAELGDDLRRLAGESVQGGAPVAARRIRPVEQDPLHPTGLVGGRQPGQGRAIVGLIGRLAGLEEGAALGVDQPGRRDREVALRIGLSGTSTRLHMETPPAAQTFEGVVQPRPDRHQLQVRGRLEIRSPKAETVGEGAVLVQHHPGGDHGRPGEMIGQERGPAAMFVEEAHVSPHASRWPGRARWRLKTSKNRLSARAA